ncbi:hypothetical protein EYE40_06815 [Glaciihabitans arcticus]|uniref:DUF6993 domain-containing protein n=1 Tax=Glaciihabitans arcticus TaxID=2668039 RepID=A0A4Q9GRE0_9MICO|nr:hypothetical protein [Glaciihabitans arcticus]TBN57135.1 hypothetical protein EYE40_06815 [Glaciihabitans arcticus]
MKRISTRGMMATAMLAAVVLSAVLAGCTTEPEPAPLPPVTSPSPSSSAEGTADPGYNPAGDARDNKQYFDTVNRAVIALDKTPGGKKFIDNLVKAGFVKADMQVTEDLTAVELVADNIQFSVLLGGACLVGQYGNVGYQSVVQPVLTSGKCMVGKTRDIDW